MSKDMQKTEEKTNRRMPTFTESVIPIIAMMVILTVGKGYLGYATEPLLLLVAAIAGLIAYRVGVTWDEMMDEICQKIAKGMPAILILTPILLPIVQAIGMDPIQFGVIMVVNLAIGFVTPPIGVNLFVASSLTEVPVMQIAKKAMPMIGFFLAALLLITFIPAISIGIL